IKLPLSITCACFREAYAKKRKECNNKMNQNIQINKSVFEHTSQPIVSYRNVTKAFGDHVVLKELNLDIMQGEKIALIGPSGSGKTTIARLLMTLEQPTSGTIEVNGEMLWHMQHKGKLIAANEKHLHRMRSSIGMVFQHFNLFPHMTILQNVME